MRSVQWTKRGPLDGRVSLTAGAVAKGDDGAGHLEADLNARQLGRRRRHVSSLGRGRNGGAFLLPSFFRALLLFLLLLHSSVAPFSFHSLACVLFLSFSFMHIHYRDFAVGVGVPEELGVVAGYARQLYKPVGVPAWGGA